VQAAGKTNWPTSSAGSFTMIFMSKNSACFQDLHDIALNMSLDGGAGSEVSYTLSLNPDYQNLQIFLSSF
jgi:hypothetical protein